MATLGRKGVKRIGDFECRQNTSVRARYSSIYDDNGGIASMNDLRKIRCVALRISLRSAYYLRRLCVAPPSFASDPLPICIPSIHPPYLLGLSTKMVHRHHKVQLRRLLHRWVGQSRDLADVAGLAHGGLWKEANAPGR